MDYAPLIEKRRERLAELEAQSADPALFQDPRRAGELMRELRRVQDLLRDWEQLLQTRRQREENHGLAGSDDAEMAELAAAELEELVKADIAKDLPVSFYDRSEEHTSELQSR